MKTQYYTASSIDGFIADPDNSLDWLFQFGDAADDADADYPEFIRQVGAIAMGSTTYQWVLDYEKLLDSRNPKPWPYEQPTWIFTSRDLPAVPGADIRFVRGDVGPVHREMVAAAAGKNVWLVGGGDLVGQFYDQELLDEIIVTMAPVTLGAGAPLLPRKITTPPLSLVRVRSLGGAFAQMTYEVRYDTP